MNTFRFIASTVGAAALAAAAPAFAQRVSLADRVAALEQQAANNQGNVDLLNQVTQLRSEVQALRAQIEELQQQNEQLKQSGRNQYLDLDGRLNRLEGNVPIAPATTTAPAPSVPAATARDSAPVVYGDAGKLAQGADERSAYNAAFDVLKAGRYAESARMFQDFLQAYPNGAYAPNALYWLGQSYYVTGNFELALEQFQTLVGRYPTHDKATDGLLKVGLSQYSLKQFDAAERTLGEVSARYPGTQIARDAEDRLNRLQAERSR